jgi:putative membrane protein insertion efficiency factor
MISQSMIALVKAYRFFLSPWLGSACRFEPTCSLYAIEALQEKGAAQGSYLIVKRLARCHPWCDGGYDPVPMANTCNDLRPNFEPIFFKDCNLKK